jgi:hypothetical protein
MSANLNRKQKLVLVVLAIVVGSFLPLEIDDQGLERTHWLLPVLVIGVIVILVLSRSPSKSIDQHRAAKIQENMANFLQQAHEQESALALSNLVEQETAFLRDMLKRRDKPAHSKISFAQLNPFLEAETIKVTFAVVSLAEHSKNGLFLKDRAFTYLQMHTLRLIEPYVEQDIWKAIEAGHAQRESVESVRERVKKAAQREMREVAKLVQIAAARSDEPFYLAIAVSFAPRLGFSGGADVVKNELCAQYLEPIWMRQIGRKRDMSARVGGP